MNCVCDVIFFVIEAERRRDGSIHNPLVPSTKKMFSFIKKTDKSDKDRRKKDKAARSAAAAALDGGSAASGGAVPGNNISSDDLMRLDEVSPK